MASANGYGGTSTGSAATPPQTNGPSDNILRTKVLLLGLRRYVAGLSTECAKAMLTCSEDPGRHPFTNTFSTTFRQSSLSTWRRLPESRDIHTSACLPSHTHGSTSEQSKTSTAIPLEIWDCPGNIGLDALDVPLTQFSTLIFVIDIQVSSSFCL